MVDILDYRWTHGIDDRQIYLRTDAVIAIVTRLDAPGVYRATLLLRGQDIQIGVESAALQKMVTEVFGVEPLVRHHWTHNAVARSAYYRQQDLVGVMRTKRTIEGVEQVVSVVILSGSANIVMNIDEREHARIERMLREEVA